MTETKARNGFVLLHGEDTPDELIDRVAFVLDRALKDEPAELMVSGCDNEEYDHYDSECE